MSDPAEASSSSVDNVIEEPNSMLHQIDAIVDDLMKQSDDPRVQLSGLECEIAKVQQILSKLKSLQPPLRRNINTLYCPIQQILPPEIISEVFLRCIPNLGTLKPPPDGEPKCTPLFLGSICSLWRHIAWTTPQLWISPSLLLSNKKIKIQGEILQQWISRSGDLSLTLRLHCNADDDRHWANIPPNTVFDIVIQNARRWQAIDLQVPTFCYETFVAPEGGFSSLRSLVINPTGGQGDRAHKLNWTDCTPQLNQISLVSVYLSTVVLRWDNITHVHVKAFYIDECLELMRRAPCLEYCNFQTIIRGEDNHGMPGEPIMLAQLHTLLLVTERVVDAGKILAKLTAPALKILTYDVSERTFDSDEFCGFIKRSACNIETLSILRCAVSEIELTKTLKLLPSVIDLKLTLFEDQGHCLGFTLITSLIPVVTSSSSTPSASTGVCVLPNLRDLDFAGMSPSNWNLWLRLLQSRRGLNDSGDVSVDDDGYLPYGSGKIALLKSASFIFDESSNDLLLPNDLVMNLRILVDRGFIFKFIAGVDMMEDDRSSEENTSGPCNS